MTHSVWRVSRTEEQRPLGNHAEGRRGKASSFLRTARARWDPCCSRRGVEADSRASAIPGRREAATQGGDQQGSPAQQQPARDPGARGRGAVRRDTHQRRPSLFPSWGGSGVRCSASDGEGPSPPSSSRGPAARSHRGGETRLLMHVTSKNFLPETPGGCAPPRRGHRAQGKMGGSTAPAQQSEGEPRRRGEGHRGHRDKEKGAREGLGSAAATSATPRAQGPARIPGHDDHFLAAPQRALLKGS